MNLFMIKTPNYAIVHQINLISLLLIDVLAAQLQIYGIIKIDNANFAHLVQVGTMFQNNV